MNDRVKLFIEGYFSPESASDRAVTHESVRNSPAEYQEDIKNGLAELLRTRSLSAVEFCRLTDAEYDSEEEVYADVAAAYEAMFEEMAPKPAVTQNDS